MTCIIVGGSAVDSTGISVALRDPLDVLYFVWSAGRTVSPSTTPRCVWDLDSFVKMVMSVLPPSCRDDLYTKSRTQFNTYRIYYIPGKVFSITKGGIDQNFYDLSQYFPDDPEPSTLLGIQRKADELWQLLVDLGMSATTTLASPVACAVSSGVLDKVKDTVPTIWDAQDNQLDAFEYALQAGAREWVSNYQVGVW